MGPVFVVVETFHNHAEAEAARMCLLDAGIRAHLTGGEIVTASWAFGNAAEQIRLEVESDIAEQAIEVLRAGRRSVVTSQNPASDETTCLACGFAMAESETECRHCGWSYGEDGDDQLEPPASRPGASLHRDSGDEMEQSPRHLGEAKPPIVTILAVAMVATFAVATLRSLAAIGEHFLGAPLIGAGLIVIILAALLIVRRINKLGDSSSNRPHSDDS